MYNHNYKVVEALDNRFNLHAQYVYKWFSRYIKKYQQFTILKKLSLLMRSLVVLGCLLWKH